MSRRLSQVLVIAMAVLFATAPFVLAQTSGSGSATSGTREQMAPGSTSMPSSQTGTMGAQDTLQATVADVNHQHNTLKLKMQGGETVEFKVPEQSLTNLNKGDSVQVSIHKAEVQPGMGTSTTPSRPESSTPGSSPSGSGTKAR